VIPSDAALIYQNLLAIPTNSEHPNAAKLFIDFIMSSEGQALLRELDYADSPTVEGSLTGEQIAEAEANGAKFIEADVEFYARQDPQEYKAGVDEILRILLGGE
jgi:ABC-type Fe3+ transport system substrate-binding protein